MSWEEAYKAKKEREGGVGVHQFKTQEEYNAFLRIAHESVSIGQNTLTAIAGQQEALDRAEGAIDSNRYLVEKSWRTLRGMSWWGSIKNYFSEEPTAPRPRASTWMTARSSASVNRASEEEVLPYEGGSRSLHPVQRESGVTKNNDAADELFRRREEMSSSTSSDRRNKQQLPATLKEVEHIQNDYLEKLDGCIDEQRAIAATLNEAVTEQSQQIENLGENSENLQERTRAVIRKASRISQSSWRQRPKFYKIAAFREKRTGKFLTVVGDDLLLLEPQLVKSCQFAAYTCQTNLTGLLSVLSRKWVGQNWLGQLKVRGSGLGKNEELEVNWQRPHETFILSCSANWGHGGYLMLGAVQQKEEEGEGGGKGRLLKIGGYDVEDRQKAALFEVIDCETYRSSDYVNEVLQPIPPGEESTELGGKKKPSREDF